MISLLDAGNDPSAAFLVVCGSAKGRHGSRILNTRWSPARAVLIALTLAGCTAGALAPETFPEEGVAVETPSSTADPLTQARMNCWMDVEHQKIKLNLDQRAAFVDKCVVNAMRDQKK